MDPDPFRRIPTPAISTPDNPSPVGGLPPSELVPDYALETPPNRRASSPTSPAFDVIAALIFSGATFVEKTGCDSGTPYTYWAPEWDTDPS